MKKISIAILTLLVTIAACKKVPEVNLKYVDVERDLITVGTTTATVQCDYQYIATLKKAYFYYGEGENEPDMNTAEMRVVQNTLYVDLAGLRENTTYSYYYEFHNGFNSMRTVAKTFKTEGSGVTITLPTVVTAEVTEITTNSAKGGGEVTDDGGAEITERGICWSINANPTISDNHVAAGSGIGSFYTVVSGLQASTTYHVRAYATNEEGTVYGLDREFVTLSGGGRGVPEGAINGLFTINANGDQVYFSQGNLQYQASTNTWRFAENQWDYVGTQKIADYWGVVTTGGTIEGSDNSDISSTYDGWIDLFGWGTSGYNHGANCYQPWSTSTNEYDYYPYGNAFSNLFDQTGKADWGYNPILNGGNQENLWRTMTELECVYVFDRRNTNSGFRYAQGTVNGIGGFILLPDNWNTNVYQLYDYNGGNYSSNIMDDASWNTLEQAGCVFFPASGTRLGSMVVDLKYCGRYWLSNFYDNYDACRLDLVNGMLNLKGSHEARFEGYSIRLITSKNK